MVTDSSGSIASVLTLPDKATKGGAGGREIPVNEDLATELAALKTENEARGDTDHYGFQSVLRCRRGRPVTANNIATRFFRLYRSLGISGASSHSGRRTFITKAARKIGEVGGSLRDVQQLVGHSSLSTTQRYIEGSSEAKRRVIALI
jgi:integrase/recombinase XerD